MAVLLSALAGEFHIAPPARAADTRPPEFMTYQGFLVDANGQPLAPNNPANYPVVFRIYDQATGGVRLWSEQQIVTIDKGNFSVLLGEGTDVSGESRPPLSTVFGGSGLAASASDRFLGVTVTISGTPTEILPRLRLLPAPYAYLARHANALVDGNGQPLVAAGTGNNLVVAGNVTANAFVGNGAGLTALDAANVASGVLADARIPGLNASKITAGVLAADRIPGLDASKITGGTLADARLSSNVARRDVSNTFATDNQINGHLRVGELVNTAPGAKGYGKALILSGAPDLSGTWNNDNSDPLWLARFNAADNQTELRINIGDDPGFSTDKLVIGTTTLAGVADFNQTGTWTPLVTIDARGFIGTGTPSPGYPLTIHSEDLDKARLRIQQSNGKYADFGRWDNFLYVQLNQSVWNSGNRYAAYDGDANWDFASDRRLKKDITDAEPMLDRVLKVQVRRFRWKDEPGDARLMLGVVAQELQTCFPEMVSEFTPPDGGEKTLTVGYGDFAVIAIKAIQELKARHDAELNRMQSQLDRLAGLEAKAARVDTLEKEVADLKRLVQKLVQADKAGSPELLGEQVARVAADLISSAPPQP
jgi:hypothetical protein